MLQDHETWIRDDSSPGGWTRGAEHDRRTSPSPLNSSRHKAHDPGLILWIVKLSRPQILAFVLLEAIGGDLHSGPDHQHRPDQPSLCDVCRIRIGRRFFVLYRLECVPGPATGIQDRPLPLAGIELQPQRLVQASVITFDRKLNALQIRSLRVSFFDRLLHRSVWPGRARHSCDHAVAA